MSIESLKRVLLGIKSDARGMRKSKLEGRLNPKPEPVTPTEEVMAEGSDEEEGAESPLEAATEGDAVKPADEDAKQKAIDEIRKLLAQV